MNQNSFSISNAGLLQLLMFYLPSSHIFTTATYLHHWCLWVRGSKGLKKKKLEKARVINLCWFLWRRATGVCPWYILNHYKESQLKAMCTYVLIHTSLMQSCCSLSWSCFGLFRVSKAESLLQSKEIVIANDVQQRQRQMRQHTHTQFKL